MKDKRIQSFSLTLLILGLFISTLIFGLVILKLDMHALLLFCLVVIMIISNYIGYSYEEMINIIVKGVEKVLETLFILILIGAIIGVWVQSGTVPALIYYGLNILTPYTFLPAGLLICSIISMSIGSAWSTVGTVGIALISIGSSLGIPLPITAGMIISGACFGDKMSPVASASNLAAMSVEADLYDHIRTMMLTTMPAQIICLVVFTIMGLRYGGNSIDLAQCNTIQNIMVSEFNINVVLVLPIVITLVMSFKRVPTLIAMFSGVLSASILSMLVQGTRLADVLRAINSGYSTETGLDVVDKVLNRGGIQSMMWMLSMMFIIVAIGSLLDEVGFLPIVVERLTNYVNRPASLITTVIITTFVNSMAVGDSYMPILISGKLFSHTFDDAGISRTMLSRSSQEGGTLTMPLVPWSTSALFFAGTLGVATIDYFPYALLCWINPILSIILAYMGVFIVYNKKKAVI